MSEASREILKIVVGDLDSHLHSFSWRIWAAKTSFYIKCPGAGFDLKFSLHGPDPAHTWHGFKLALDGDTDSPETVVVMTPNWLPLVFPGHLVDTGSELVSHLVLRLRMPWDIFDRPSAWPVARLRTGDQGLRVSAPPILRSADVDFYVSEGAPFWPNEAQARADNATVGPLRNTADQYLTAVSVRRDLISSPTPEHALGIGPRTHDDAVRGTGGCLDELGFMWVVEQWISRSALSGRSAAVGRYSPAALVQAFEHELLSDFRLKLPDGKG